MNPCLCCQKVCHQKVCVYLVCVAVMCKYVGIARKLPDELEVLLVIFLCNALVFDFLNTLLAISPRVVFLIKRLWCQWPSHQRVLRYVYLRLDVPRCKSCALVHLGFNFVSLPTLFWAVPVLFPMQLWAVLGSFCQLWSAPGSSW